MVFYELLSALSEFFPTGYMSSDTEALIHSMLSIESSVSARPDILYIVKDRKWLSEITISDNTGIYNILVLQRIDELPSNLSMKKLNLYYIDVPDCHFTIMEKISRMIAMEQKIHAIMRTLTGAFFSNRGNQYLLDCAHSLLKNPIIQFGTINETVILSCEEDELSSLPILQKLADQVQARKTTPPDPVILSQLFNKELLNSSSQNKEAELLHTYNHALGRDQLTVLIKVKRIDVGVITCIAAAHPFGEYDKEILYRLSLLVGQELQKKSLYTRNPNELKALFLNHLVTSQTISSDYIYQMTKMCHILEIKDKFYLMVIESNDDVVSLDPNIFPNLLHQIQPILIHSFYLIRDTEIVLLFNLSEKANIHEMIDEYLAPKLEKYHLIAGISNMYHDLRLTCSHYHQAKKASSLAVEYQDQILNYFSDMAPKELLHYVARHEDLLPFCVPELLDLLQYDKENSTDLITTLYVYLDTFGKASLSAQLLFIHKNTLLYRISKIKDILHCDLEKGEDIYKLMMSLRILRTLKLYILPESLKPFM